MTVPQIIYIVAVLIYLIFFVLFLRFFFWKAYADLNFWRRKPYLDVGIVKKLARKKGRDLPFMSIVVPARNEADVIEKTVDHMLSLNYPADHYEVLIATDEKEILAREEKLPGWVEQAESFIRGSLPRGKLAPQARTLVLGFLAARCVEICCDGPRPGIQLFSAKALPQVAVDRLRTIVRELAEQIVLVRDNMPWARLNLLVCRHFSNESEEFSEKAYPVCLSMAITTALSFWMHDNQDLTRDRQRVLMRAWHRLCRIEGGLTPQVANHLSTTLAGKMLAEVRTLTDQTKLDRVLNDLARECLPTTQDIVEKELKKLPRDGSCPVLKHVVVPFDFDGKVGGTRTGWSVPSTKGRALNYALGFLDPRSEMSGFYDAESRPDPDVLLYVAFRRIGDGERVNLLQGPVFQVRNFYQMGPFCKIASLYQAIAHDWYLPALFKRLPFVGGTNLFVETCLIKSIGGYDHAALTEDLELGARAYLLKGAWPEYLPYYSSEQTPPTFYAFFRQRLRWGTGHLQVMDKIRAESGYPVERKRPLLRQLFIKGQVEWVIYQSATFVPPIVLTLWWRGWVDPYVLPDAVRWVLNAFSATYIAFTIYAYYRYMPYLDAWSRPRSLLGRAMVVIQLFFLPMAAFFFPVPYSSAMVLKALGKHPRTWTKTPRTKE